MNKKNLMISALAVTVMLGLTACKNTAEEEYNNGVNSFNAGNYESACISFANAIEEDCEKAEYYIYYGMSLIACGKNEEAVIQFNKAILDTDNKIVRQNNKKALRGKGIAYFEYAQYDKAIDCFYEALNIKEYSYMNYDITRYLADSLYELGEYTEAIKLLSDAIKEDSTDATAYFRSAQCEMMTGEYDFAITDFNNAIKYDPTNYDYYFGKYEALTQLGKDEDAEATIEKALAIRGKEEENSFAIARLYFLVNDYDKATALLERELAAENFQSAYYLGVIARKNKNAKQAYDYMKTFLDNEVSQRNSSAYNEIIIDSIYTKNYDEAIKYMEPALKLKDSHYQIIRFNQIVLYEKMGDYLKAFELATAYCKDFPDDKIMARELKFIETRV